MAGLTKDELKSALVTHGVELNFSSAKKDELLELYDEYVAPNDLKAGEFSSDDEDLPLKSPKKKTSKSSKAASEKSAKAAPKELTEENSFIVGDIKIKDLNDEELIQYLTKYGIDVGPIVDSTRSLYQKKLAIVMREQDGVDGGAEENGHTNGTNGKLDKSLEEFSADDEVPEPEEEEVVVKKSSRKSATPKVAASESKSPLQALGNSLRQRFDKNRSEKPERFTPTPRRSIHTYKVTETTTQTMTKGKDGVVSIDKISTKETSESTNQTGGNKVAQVMRKVLPGVLMVLILLALAYYITSKKRS